MSDKPVADLSNMTISEVAVCRRGMNQGAMVALFKSADGVTPSPSNSSEATSMSTTSGAAPPGSVAKTDPPAFKPCNNCKDSEACTKAGKCALAPPIAKGTLTLADDVPAADPFAKTGKEVMDDLFKGIANPSPTLVAGILKIFADGKEMLATEISKAVGTIARIKEPLAKSDEAKTFGQVLPGELVLADWWRFGDALCTALRSILSSAEPDSVKLQLAADSLEEFKNVMTARVVASIAATTAAVGSLLKVEPNPPPAPTISKGDPAVSGTDNTTLTDTLAKAASVEDVIKALPESAAALVTAAIAKGATPAEDPIAKALETNPILKAQFATMQKAVDEANAIAKAEKEAREHGVRITKAGTDFPNLPTTAENMAGVLKAMETMDEPVRKTLTEVLKAGNEAIGKNVLGGEIGSSAVSKAGVSTTMGTINAKADELMKADATLTKADAIEKVLDADVQLQKAYLEEMK